MYCADRFISNFNRIEPLGNHFPKGLFFCAIVGIADNRFSLQKNGYQLSKSLKIIFLQLAG